MFDIWDLINSADLGGKAKTVLLSLDATDPRLLAVPIVLAVYLGSKMVAGQPNLRRLGLRLGAAAFLVYGGYCFYEVGAFDTKALPGIALRAGNAGGFVLAVTWTLLPIVTFVYAHLRLALAAFVAYTGYALATMEEFHADQLPAIALRGLAAVALVLLIAWILHPIWDFFRDLLPRPRSKEEAEEPRLGRRGRRRRAETRKIEPEVTVLSAPAPPPVAAPAAVTASPAPAVVVPPVAAPPPVCVEPMPSSPSPEHAEAQRRRDRTRLQIEMAYVLALPQIGDRLPRATFDDFVRRYLGDHLPPDDLEENARQLQQILQEHQRQAQAAPSEAIIALIREEAIGDSPRTDVSVSLPSDPWVEQRESETAKRPEAAG